MLYSNISKKLLENIKNNEKQKFVIYPYGEGGYLAKQILNTTFDIQEEFIIDNKISEINRKIKNVDFLDGLDVNEYTYIISSDNTSILTSLLLKGVSGKNIICLFDNIIGGISALEKLLTSYKFNSVLDIGADKCIHSRIFEDYGKKVTAIDCSKKNINFLNNKDNLIIDDIYNHNFEEKFDCIWCSHMIEHIHDVNKFFIKVKEILKEDGIFALTVPPMENTILAGHVQFFNAGILLYNLVLAGFNCKDVSILKYSYNISIILRKNSISYENRPKVMKEVINYLPDNFEYKIDNCGNPSFDGDINELNWK